MVAPIRLQIAGTNKLFCECLASVVKALGRFTVVDSGGGLTTMKREFLEEPPDVLLIDLSQSREAVLLLIDELTREVATVRILLLGVEEEQRDGLRGMEAGAKGYVPIDGSLADLYAAIDRALAGELVYSPSITPEMFCRVAELSRMRRRRIFLDSLQLTSREKEILSHIAEDLGNKEIAKRLNLSPHTVKNHIHSILKKLKVPSRYAAVKIAIEKGWIEGRRRRPI